MLSNQIGNIPRDQLTKSQTEQRPLNGTDITEYSITFSNKLTFYLRSSNLRHDSHNEPSTHNHKSPSQVRSNTKYTHAHCTTGPFTRTDEFVCNRVIGVLCP